MNELMQKFQAAMKSATDAFEAGKLEEGRAFRVEAETLKSALDEIAKLDELQKSFQPMRPALPGTTNTEFTTPGLNDKRESAVKTGESMLDAAYATRFGDTPAMVKQILTELHGNDYQANYWAQKSAFKRYLRLGNEALTSEHRSLLSNMVMTPGSVKMALGQGVEDMNTFKTTMVEAADTLGGYMVPVDFQMKLIERLAGLTVIRGKASQMNTTRDRVEMPEATGASGKYTSPVRVTWVDETPTIGSIAENYVTFGLRGIPVHTAMAETPLSRNLIEDSAFDIEGYLAKKLAEAAAIDEDRQFILGTGIGKPLGLLPSSANYHALTSVRAVENALGIAIPKNANLIRNLMQATLYVHDHLVHFYHLHALDWVDVVSALKADPKWSATLTTATANGANQSRRRERAGMCAGSCACSASSWKAWC